MMMLGYDPIENRPISEEVEIEEQEPDRVLIDTELASWQRYALRNLKKQKRRAFVTKHIPDYMSDNIRMQLSQSTTAEEVRAAFEPSRFLGFTTY
jgi:hypothetical protein